MSSYFSRGQDAYSLMSQAYSRMSDACSLMSRACSRMSDACSRMSVDLREAQKILRVASDDNYFQESAHCALIVVSNEVRNLDLRFVGSFNRTIVKQMIQIQTLPVKTNPRVYSQA